jgi:fructose-1-phosphate kinase PfkB-like protein
MAEHRTAAVIVVPALHPCHEVIVQVNMLRAGTVEQAARTVVGVGGKAVNVARAVAAMGASVRLVALADERLSETLRSDPALQSVDLTVVPSLVESRTDVAIVDSEGNLTVLNSRAADPGQGAIEAVLMATLGGLRDGDLLVLSGSLPLGAEGAIARSIEAAKRHGALVALDASGPALLEGLAAAPDVLKVAADELAAVSGMTAADALARGPVLAPGVDLVVLSHGARGLRAWLPGGPVDVRPPAVRAMNPLGAGDALMAGLPLASQPARTRWTPSCRLRLWRRRRWSASTRRSTRSAPVSCVGR